MTLKQLLESDLLTSIIEFIGIRTSKLNLHDVVMIKFDKYDFEVMCDIITSQEYDPSMLDYCVAEITANDAGKFNIYVAREEF